MEAKELEALIRFHEAGLSQYRQYINPAAQYLEEQTIKALGELRDIELDKDAQKSDAMKSAQDILQKRLSKGD